MIEAGWQTDTAWTFGTGPNVACDVCGEIFSGGYLFREDGEKKLICSSCDAAGRVLAARQERKWKEIV